jgi:hypothetical protein
MGPCTLQIGRRVVLVSHDGPPAAELAMFDGADIELAETASGAGLREAGYRTVAYEARRRLAVAGVTLALADEAALAMRGLLTLAYARGAVVRRVARKLGASELFDGGVYDGALRRYEGAWLDLPLLANDAGLAGGTAIFQALGLIALLAEVSDDAPVVLSTSEHAPVARIGERTLRKHAFDAARTLPTALLRRLPVRRTTRSWRASTSACARRRSRRSAITCSPSSVASRDAIHRRTGRSPILSCGPLRRSSTTATPSASSIASTRSSRSAAASRGRRT